LCSETVISQLHESRVLDSKGKFRLRVHFPPGFAATEELENQFWLLDLDFCIWHLSFFGVVFWTLHFHLLTGCKYCFFGQGIKKASSDAIAMGECKTAQGEDRVDNKLV